ncbi:MAG TPA: Tad domain-containing protein [Candidatus Limnocylindrales bacterium]|nr:Tad domain-containing protein [Candidatus Limnocylindrales bacterium]
MLKGKPFVGESSGQAIVLMVGVLMAVLIVVALTVDGGNVWAHQRIVQNGSDSASEAGAIILAEKLAQANPTWTSAQWDAAVASAVRSNATANGITLNGAYYTDICGIPLQPNGLAALNADGSYDFATASAVGSGNLPSSSATTPDCPSLSVGPPAGVLVQGHKSVGTYVAGIVGIRSIGVDTRATAVAGYLQGFCDASQGSACSLLPVTIPVNIVTCDGSNNPVNTGSAWVLNQLYKVPLCQNGPGNVGWVDWTPPAGGTSELIEAINTPNNPAIDLPSWQDMTSTGNINSLGVENALRNYDGQVVMIPQFDLSCDPGPNGSPDSSQPAIVTAPNYGCPAGDLGGKGQNQWYRIPSFAFFQLCSSTDADCVAANASHGAYTNGNDGSGICDTGNGATSCLVGKFVKILATGTVGPGVGGGGSNNPVVGVQLIK